MKRVVLIISNVMTVNDITLVKQAEPSKEDIKYT